jgi:polysaccharide biosynthesis transport protein
MTFSQFIAILRARKWAALLVFTLVVATAVTVSLLLPRKYSGTASVVIDAKPDPVSPMAYPTMALPSFMATQVDILQSDRVALKVIRDLKLAENPQIRQQWLTDGEGKGTVEQWLTELLQKQLDVKPSRESNVIQVTYKATDPNFAAGLANAFAQAYIATTLQLRVDPAKQFSSFFDNQTKEARESLERAQAKVSAYQRANGIIATDERLDVETARLNELSSQLVQLQAISAESTSRQTQAQGATGDRIQDVLNNPLISGLKADLGRSEARLQELSSRFGDNHPQVVELKASIAELRKRVETETGRVTGGVSVSNNINTARVGQVQRGLDEQRAKLLRMKAVRDEGQVLIREVENAQRTFETLVARFNQTSLESQTTQSFASVLSVALPPVEPSSPKLLLNTALAVFVGLLLALGVALLLELTDRRVRAPEDVVAALGLPVLGLLPKPSSKRFLGSRQARALKQRVIGLPAPQRNA